MNTINLSQLEKSFRDLSKAMSPIRENVFEYYRTKTDKQLKYIWLSLILLSCFVLAEAVVICWIA